jgi:hypothetical protein
MAHESSTLPGSRPRPVAHGAAGAGPLPAAAPSVQGRPAPAPGWADIWLAAISRPRLSTFERLAARPQASTRQAYIWLGAAALFGWAVPALASLARGGLPAPAAVLAVAILAGLTLAWFSLAHGAADYVARHLGVRSPFDRMAYTAAAFCAPLVIVAGALMAGPGFLRALLLPLLGYAFYLDVLAIRAVYRLGWWQGLAAAAPGTLLMLVPLAAVAAVALQLM